MRHEFKNLEDARRYSELLAQIDANPPKVCTKYEFVNALQKIDSQLYAALYNAYQENAQLQFMWNTVNELNRENSDFIRISQSLNVSNEVLYDVFHLIGVLRLQKIFFS